MKTGTFRYVEPHIYFWLIYLILETIKLCFIVFVKSEKMYLLQSLFGQIKNSSEKVYTEVEIGYKAQSNSQLVAYNTSCMKQMADSQRMKFKLFFLNTSSWVIMTRLTNSQTNLPTKNVSECLFSQFANGVWYNKADICRDTAPIQTLG